MQFMIASSVSAIEKSKRTIVFYTGYYSVDYQDIVRCKCLGTGIDVYILEDSYEVRQ